MHLKPVSIVPAGFYRPSDIYSSLSVLFCELEIMKLWPTLIGYDNDSGLSRLRWEPSSEAFYPHNLSRKDRCQDKTGLGCLSLVGKGNDRSHHSRFRMRPCRVAESFRDHGHFFPCLQSLQGVGVSVGDEGVGVPDAVPGAGALQSYFQAHPEKYAAPTSAVQESLGSSPVISEVSNCRPFSLFCSKVTIKPGVAAPMTE